MRFYILLLSFTIALTSSLQAQELKQTPAQAPDTPAPLQAAVDGGAQVYYLGEYEGMYGWALIRQGRPEFFYGNKEGTVLIMGLMFDGQGEMITNGQLAQLRSNEGDDMFAMTGDLDEVNNTPTSTAPTNIVSENTPTAADGLATSIMPEFVELTPAQQMFLDVQAANWITYGQNGKYELFAFVDPDCPHCQRFMAEAKPLADAGILKLRLLPIGINPESEKRAALILAGANPVDRFLKYGGGDASALDYPADINVSGVQKNKDVLLKWGFDVTPIIVYRSGTGDIRVVRGRPQDMDTLVRDLSTQ